MLVVRTEIPLGIFAVSVLFQELVLILGRRGMLAPVVADVFDGFPVTDQLLCVVKGFLVEFHSHSTTPLGLGIQ